MYYLCSENKGADQLHSYHEADLRLCFRICKKPFFSGRGSYAKSRKLILEFKSRIELKKDQIGIVMDLQVFQQKTSKLIDYLWRWNVISNYSYKDNSVFVLPFDLYIISNKIPPTP